MNKVTQSMFFITIALFISSSCEHEMQNLESQPSICGANDPINNLPWLKAKIDSAKLTPEFGIFSYRYQGRVVFELTDNPTGQPRSGYAVVFVDCQGNELCSISSGVAYINSCGNDFASKLTDKKILYIK